MKHLEEVQETYHEHRRFAWKISFQLLKGAAALFIHGLIPGWFKHTGTTAVLRAENDIKNRRLDKLFR